MDSVRDFAVMLCSASVAVAFVTYLVPDGALKKTVNSVVTLFFMCMCIIPAFGDGDFDIDFSSLLVDELPDEEDYIADAQDFYLRSGENIVNEQIDELLGNICSADYSFDVDMSFDPDGNLMLQSINITVTQEDSVNIARITTQIGSLTGIKPEVEVE